MQQACNGYLMYPLWVKWQPSEEKEANNTFVPLAIRTHS